MYFPLSADQRYEAERGNPPDSALSKGIDQGWVYHIEDGLCALIRATYVYVPVKSGVLTYHIGHQGAPHGQTPGGPAFVYSDPEELADIMQRLCDPDIKAAVFYTETGEYAPIWITKDTVNQDHWRGAPWFRVHHRHPETGRILGGSSL